MTNKPARERDVVELREQLFALDWKATVPDDLQSEVRMLFNEALAGGPNMNGDAGPTLTVNHALDCLSATKEIIRLRELLEAPSPQPDTDVVERVARAIDPHAFNDPTGDSYVEARICRAFEKARAAIAALNASTPEIQREALEAIAKTTFIGITSPSEQCRIVALESAHDIAIAALKQDEENHGD